WPSLPSLLAAVRKIRSPQRTGVEFPVPGNLVFQRRFLVSLHSSGTLELPAYPCPLGPRHEAHPSALLLAFWGAARPDPDRMRKQVQKAQGAIDREMVRPLMVHLLRQREGR